MQIIKMTWALTSLLYCSINPPYSSLLNRLTHQTCSYWQCGMLSSCVTVKNMCMLLAKSSWEKSPWIWIVYHLHHDLCEILTLSLNVFIANVASLNHSVPWDSLKEQKLGRETRAEDDGIMLEYWNKVQQRVNTRRLSSSQNAGTNVRHDATYECFYV
jgi:hypothetical protein